MKYKLICFDMDGVIFKGISFWMELHKRFGTFKQGKALTDRYLHTDYGRLVEEVVVKLWKGKDAKPYYDLVNSLEYLPGVRESFEYIHDREYITAVISSSSIDAAKRVQKDFGVEHIFANQLVIKNGRVSGEFIWPIGAGKEKKVEIVRELCSDLGISSKETIYIGNDDTDIDAFKEVGMSIAFNSDSKQLKKAAKHVVDTNNLSHVLEYIP